MPGNLSIWEVMIVLALLLLVFGAKRLPEMGRSLGRGMREFKEAVTGKADEEPAKTELTPPPGASGTSSTTQSSETERVSS